MTSLQVAFWIGIGLAVAGNVIIYIKNITTMAKKAETKKKLSLKSIMATQEFKDKMNELGYNPAASSWENLLRVHKEHFERNQKGNPDAQWDFDNEKYQDPVKLAKRLAEYAKQRDVAASRSSLRKKLNALSPKRQAVIVSQFQQLLECYLEDENFFDDFSISHVRAEHMVKLYEKRLEEAKKRLNGLI